MTVQTSPLAFTIGLVCALLARPDEALADGGAQVEGEVAYRAVSALHKDVLVVASPAPTEESGPPLVVVPVDADTPPTWKLAVQACAGLHNAQEGGSVYTLMQDKDRPWLKELKLRPTTTLRPKAFVQACMERFPRSVRYSYAAQQRLLPNILTVSAVLEAVPIDTEMGLGQGQVVFDATREFAGLNTPYLATKFVYESYVQQTTGLAMLNPGYCTQGCKVWRPELTADIRPDLVDLVFSKKLFALFLVNGCTPLSEERELLTQITAENPWPVPIGVYGYNNSWMVFGGYLHEAQTRCVDTRKMGAIPTETNNLSFFSSRRSKRVAEGRIPQNPPEQVEYSPEQTFVAFVVGDGDNIAYMLDARRRWLRQRLAFCAESEDTCAPLTWTISPHLRHLAPEILDWYYEAAGQTGRDYFMLPPSGYLYAYPSSLAEGVQDQFVDRTEQAARFLGTHSTVSWEWFDSWRRAEKSFLPKYAKQDGSVQGIFAVNVPYLFPTGTWRKNQFFKVLTGKDAGRVVLFAPRSWRGIDGGGGLSRGRFQLTPEQMAAELGNYPHGTVSYVYMTSDGGLTLENAFVELTKVLPKHVRLVSADTAARLALEASDNTWGTPVSFQTAHGTYLVAEDNGAAAVNANRRTKGPWERFHLVPRGAGLRDGARVAIQTGSGHFLSAKPRGGLHADRLQVGEWEEFVLINHSAPGRLLKSGHKVSLRSAHGKYVVAEDRGAAHANRHEVGSWETFRVIFYE